MDATHTSSHLRVDKNIQFKDKFDEIDLVMWNIDRDIVMNQNFQRDYPIPIEAMEKFFEIFELPTQKDYDFFDKVLLVTNGDLAHVLKELNI